MFDDDQLGPVVIAALVLLCLAVVWFAPIGALVVVLAGEFLRMRKTAAFGAIAVGLGIVLVRDLDGLGDDLDMLTPVWGLPDEVPAVGIHGIAAAAIGPALVSGAILSALFWFIWNFSRPFWYPQTRRPGVVGELRQRRELRRSARVPVVIERARGAPEPVGERKALMASSTATMTRRRARVLPPAWQRAAIPYGVADGIDVASLPIHDLTEHTLVVGATGSGVTTTTERILDGALALGLGVVFVDLKGDSALAWRLGARAENWDRRARIWAIDDQRESWNPLALGDITELADKLAGLEDWTEPRGRRLAQRHLGWVLRVARELDETLELERVAQITAVEDLTAVAGEVAEPTRSQVRDYLAHMDDAARSIADGLANRIYLLCESVAEGSLSERPGALDLRRSLARGECVVFSLSSARYPDAAIDLATLALADLGVVCSERHHALSEGWPLAPALVVVEGFTVLDRDLITVLLSRTRGSQVGLVLVAQEVSDLARMAPEFRDFVIGNTLTRIVHRQNVAESAEVWTTLAGTRQSYEETWQIEGQGRRRLGRAVVGGWFGAQTGRGTLRLTRVPKVAPDEFTTLRRGRAVVIRGGDNPRVQRVSVWPPAVGDGSGRGAPGEQDRSGEGSREMRSEDRWVTTQLLEEFEPPDHSDRQDHGEEP